MTEEGFKFILKENVKLLGKNKALTHVEDMRQFLDLNILELIAWKTKELFSKYVVNGLKKQALLIPKQVPEISSDSSKIEGVLIQSFFD